MSFFKKNVINLLFNLLDSFYYFQIKNTSFNGNYLYLNMLFTGYLLFMNSVFIKIDKRQFKYYLIEENDNSMNLFYTV